MLLDLRSLWEAIATFVLAAADLATAADDAAVLAGLANDDPAGALDNAALLADVRPDDPASATELGQVSAAATFAELIAPSDDLAISVTAAANDDAISVDDAQVSVVEFLTAGDTATIDEAADIVESLPTEPVAVGLGTQVRRRRPEAQGAEIGEGAAAREDGSVYASMHGGDRSTTEHTATVERWPDARYANPAILAMIAALEEAA